MTIPRKEISDFMNMAEMRWQQLEALKKAGRDVPALAVDPMNSLDNAVREFEHARLTGGIGNIRNAAATVAIICARINAGDG